MNAVARARHALDRHPRKECPRDEFTARFAAKGAKFTGLQDERVAADSAADSADDCARQSFVVNRLHDKRAAQRIADCGFTGLLDLADPFPVTKANYFNRLRKTRDGIHVLDRGRFGKRLGRLGRLLRGGRTRKNGPLKNGLCG